MDFMFNKTKLDLGVIVAQLGINPESFEKWKSSDNHLPQSVRTKRSFIIGSCFNQRTLVIGEKMYFFLAKTQKRKRKEYVTIRKQWTPLS
jgi:hypothetical protein